MPGLEDRSRRVREHPWRIAADIEEAICELQLALVDNRRARLRFCRPGVHRFAFRRVTYPQRTRTVRDGS